MRLIYFVIFLVSFGSVCMGGYGDYSCTLKNLVRIKDHKLAHGNKSFTFGITWERSVIKFHYEKGNHDVSAVAIFDLPPKLPGFWEITLDTDNPEDQYFLGYRLGATVNFYKGDLLYSVVGSNGPGTSKIYSVSAICNKT